MEPEITEDRPREGSGAPLDGGGMNFSSGSIAC